MHFIIYARSDSLYTAQLAKYVYIYIDFISKGIMRFVWIAFLRTSLCSIPRFPMRVALSFKMPMNLFSFSWARLRAAFFGAIGLLLLLLQLWDHPGVTLVYFWHMRMTLGWLWDTLGTLWDHFGVTSPTLGSLWGHFGHMRVAAGSFWSVFKTYILRMDSNDFMQL